MRIYITGASCAGVTTLGQHLATLLDIRQVDVDDFYWMPTQPPFTTKRPPSDRVSLMQHALGDEPVRLERLAARETARYGDRIAPDGDMYHIHVAFKTWASQYDDPSFSGRNRAQHEAWLSRQTAPVLRVDGINSVEQMATDVVRGCRTFDIRYRQGSGKT